MAINQNHLFEELGNVKCAIVEKNVKPERLAFLRELLELNGYTVVAVPTPPPKAAPVPTPATPTAQPANPGDPTAAAPPPPPPPPPPPMPETYTVGVTDITFNPTNAIFGRLLRTKEGNVVTLAYWHQKEEIARDEIPYFQKRR